MRSPDHPVDSSFAINAFCSNSGYVRLPRRNTEPFGHRSGIPRLDLVLKLTPQLPLFGYIIEASTHTVWTPGESHYNLNGGDSNVVAKEKRGLEWNGEGRYSTWRKLASA
jgi:hypothetical protein